MNIFPTKKLLLKASILCSLLVLFSACGVNNTDNSGNGNIASPTPVKTSNAVNTPISASTPAVSLGPQSCPVAIQSLSYWNTIISTQTGVSKVENVSCGYLKGQQATLQALVTVRYDGSDRRLDAYVYDLTATPARLFSLENLAMGNAKISSYNTVLTAEADPASSVNAQQADATMTPDLFREFQWSSSVGTLVQVAFPGIFPDLTRYQAETDQEQVNQGHQTWKQSATLTAQAFGASLLHWDANSPATIVSGGGQQDAQAVVTLSSGHAGGGSIKLTMSRLEGNTNGGIWIVIAAQSAGASISAPPALGLITSPVAINGTGNAFEGVIGTVNILDHLNNTLGTTQVHGATGNGNTTFATSVTYNRTFTTGAEEGLIMLSEPSNANGSIAGAVFVKALID